MKKLSILEAQSGAANARVNNVNSNKKVVKVFKRTTPVQPTQQPEQQPQPVVKEVVVKPAEVKEENVVGTGKSPKPYNKSAVNKGLNGMFPNPIPPVKKYLVEHVSNRLVDNVVSIRSAITKAGLDKKPVHKDLGTVSTITLEYCRDKNIKVSQYKELFKLVRTTRNELSLRNLKGFMSDFLEGLGKISTKGCPNEMVENFLTNVGYILYADYSDEEMLAKVEDGYVSFDNYDYFIQDEVEVLTESQNNVGKVDKFLELIEGKEENDYAFGQLIRLYFNLCEAVYSLAPIIDAEYITNSTFDMHGNINKFSARDELEYLKSHTCSPRIIYNVIGVPWLDMIFYKSVRHGGYVKTLKNECFRKNKSIILTSRVSQNDALEIKALKEILNQTQDYFVNNKTLSKRYWGNFYFFFKESLVSQKLKKLRVQIGEEVDTKMPCYTIWRPESI